MLYKDAHDLKEAYVQGNIAKFDIEVDWATEAGRLISKKGKNNYTDTLKMKEPKIITRLSLYSEEDESAIIDINSIQGNLPKIDQHYKKGEDRLLKTGKLQPFKNKGTVIQFINIYYSFDLSDVNKNWVNFWDTYFPELQKIREKYKFRIYLHYEVIGPDYPAFIFSPDFAAFLAKFQIELSMDIYNE